MTRPSESRSESRPPDAGPVAAASAVTGPGGSSDVGIPTDSDGKLWALVGVASGAGVSVAANVLHSFIRPAGAPKDWTPQLGAVFGAVWWPLSLFLALEVLVSGRWGATRRWVAARVVMVAPVAAVAAVVSYHHLSGLLASWGEDWFTVRFGPVAVDGLMMVCSAALYRARISAGQPAVRVDQATLAEQITAAVTGAVADVVNTVTSSAYMPEIPERPDDAVAVVYRLYGEPGDLLYVGCSVDPQARFRAHGRRQPWWDEVVASEVIWYSSLDVAAGVEQQAIFTENPVYNLGTARYGYAAQVAGREPVAEPAGDAGPAHLTVLTEPPAEPAFKPARSGLASPLRSGQPLARRAGRKPARSGLQECGCGLDYCPGMVPKSTRTAHHRRVREAAELASRVSQNGHREPVTAR